MKKLNKNQFLNYIIENDVRSLHKESVWVKPEHYIVLTDGKVVFAALRDQYFDKVELVPFKKNNVFTDEVREVASKLKIELPFSFSQIEKELMKHTKWKAKKAAAALNCWAVMNDLPLYFRFYQSGGMYSNPRVNGWDPNGDKKEGIFVSYHAGDAWVGSSSSAIIVEKKILVRDFYSHQKESIKMEKKLTEFLNNR